MHHADGPSLAERLSVRARGGARWAGAFLRGPRRVSLPGAAALGCFVAAGLTVSLMAGLVVAGASLLIIDWKMVGPDGR